MLDTTSIVILASSVTLTVPPASQLQAPVFHATLGIITTTLLKPV